MGARIEDGKLTITVFRSALANAICWHLSATTLMQARGRPNSGQYRDASRSPRDPTQPSVA
jgi:hypothetical protein